MAPDAPSFTIGSAGVRIVDSGQVIPFRYEKAKIGAVLRMPVAADSVGGKNIFQRSDDHFYRIIYSAGHPIIRIAFGKEGDLKNYVRHPSTDC